MRILAQIRHLPALHCCDRNIGCLCRACLPVYALAGGEHPSMAAMIPLNTCHSIGFRMKHTAPPPLKLCASIRFMSPMHTANTTSVACLPVSGIVTAHLLWSTVVFQPLPASRMYTCLMLRDSYEDCGGQLDGRGFQPFSQLCTSKPARNQGPV